MQLSNKQADWNAIKDALKANHLNPAIDTSELEVWDDLEGNDPEVCIQAGNKEIKLPDNHFMLQVAKRLKAELDDEEGGYRMFILTPELAAKLDKECKL